MGATATRADFEAEVLRAEEPVLALFHARWCPFCRTFLSHFRSSPRGEVRRAEVDISDTSDPLWDAYGIEVVPTLLLFHRGEVVGRADGRHLRGLGPGDLQRMIRLARQKR